MLLKGGKIRDKVALATYLAMDVTRRRINVFLISSGINKQEATKIGLNVSDSIDNVLDTVLKSTHVNTHIGVVTHRGDVVFRMNK